MVIDRIKQIVKPIYRKWVLLRHSRSGSKPWSSGYNLYKQLEIIETLDSNVILNIFKDKANLPDKFGYHIDERIIEYPWLFSRLKSAPKRTLDAGSALNFYWLIDRLQLLNRTLTIFTLAPEGRVYATHGISYEYGDLRDMPFRDHWFDEIVSISTLEHVGSSNKIYVKADEQTYGTGGFKDAGKELWRILKPDGDLYITVPYGQDEIVTIQGEPFMRQFDKVQLQQLLDCFDSATIDLTFYQYFETGWQLSTQEACDTVHYFNIHETKELDEDYAAAARAVCCIHAHRNS